MAIPFHHQQISFPTPASASLNGYGAVERVQSMYPSEQAFRARSERPNEHGHSSPPSSCPEHVPALLAFPLATGPPAFVAQTDGLIQQERNGFVSSFNEPQAGMPAMQMPTFSARNDLALSPSPPSYLSPQPLEPMRTSIPGNSKPYSTPPSYLKHASNQHQALSEQGPMGLQHVPSMPGFPDCAPLQCAQNPPLPAGFASSSLTGPVIIQDQMQSMYQMQEPYQAQREQHHQKSSHIIRNGVIGGAIGLAGATILNGIASGNPNDTMLTNIMNGVMSLAGSSESGPDYSNNAQQGTDNFTPIQTSGNDAPFTNAFDQPIQNVALCDLPPVGPVNGGGTPNAQNSNTIAQENQAFLNAAYLEEMRHRNAMISMFRTT